jgi:uncharacterized protein YndB with AHSA1/START domain
MTGSVTPAEDEVVCEIEIDAPPEKVFEALTKQAQLFEWWGREPSVELELFEMDPRKGGKWRFLGRPKKGSNHGEVGEQLKKNDATEFEAHGEILEFQPPKRLTWSWIANWHEDASHRTTVAWELVPAKGGTRVRVTHAGLSREPAARKDYKGGWQGVLKLLFTFMQTP